MAESSSRGDRPESFVDLLREAYLERSSGVIETRLEGAEPLYLRKGEIFVDRDGPLASRVAAVVARAATLPRPAADPQMREAAATLVDQMLQAESTVAARLRSEPPAGIEIVGPIATVCVLLEAVGRVSTEGAMLALLGGAAERYVGRQKTPALEQLPGLEPSMAAVYGQLERPITIAELLRGGGTRLDTLRGLTRLWAVGLADREARQTQDFDERELVTDRVLRPFLSRLGEDLGRNPLDLPVGDHRAFVAKLLASFAGADHYQLLGLELTATSEEILSSFNHLARRVHPTHAQRLGLGGKEDAMQVLFERATEAYLVLSDPVRRSSYNTLIGRRRDVEVEEEQRRDEKLKVAHEHYLRGTEALSQMDYWTAAEMLKEAARLDPRVRNFTLLAQAQAKNPRWRRHAVRSYRQAIEMSEGDTSTLHLALAKVLEQEERIKEAVVAYREVLRQVPGHATAEEAVARLGGSAKAATSNTARSGLRDILSRRRQ